MCVGLTTISSFRDISEGFLPASWMRGRRPAHAPIARSGVKLTTVSQATVQNLIELQSDVVTAALNDVAVRLERATRAENIIEFVREQIGVYRGSERVATMDPGVKQFAVDGTRASKVAIRSRRTETK